MDSPPLGGGGIGPGSDAVGDKVLLRASACTVCDRRRRPQLLREGQGSKKAGRTRSRRRRRRQFESRFGFGGIHAEFYERGFILKRSPRFYEPTISVYII